METNERDVQTRDGLTLRIQEGGDLSGFPVLVHHGTPASRLMLDLWLEDAARRGIRLISHDRPGYGGSDPRPGRKLSDEAADAAAIADSLGFEHFATWGVSGGGGPALACAALLPERVTAAACLAGLNPYEERGDEITEGMGEDNIQEYGAALEGEASLRPLLEKEAAEMIGAGREGLAETMESILTGVDKAAASGPLFDYLFDWTRLGLDGGIEGWLEDDISHVSPWGFDVRDIKVPVLIVQGRQDLMVPMSHAEWFVDNIPGAEAWLSEEEGHLTLIANRIPDVHAWLLSHSI